jgi:hypothetical protein
MSDECNTQLENHLGDPGADGMNFDELGYEGVNWIHLAQDRGQWREYVNTAVNLQVP